MTAGTDRPAGVLTVRVEDPSTFLAHTLPVEVRDAGHRLVAAGSGGWTGPVAPGLYSIVLMGPAGVRLTHLAHVGAGEETAVVLEPSPRVEPPSWPTTAPGTAGGPSAEPEEAAGRPSTSRGLAEAGRAIRPALGPRLLGTERCRVLADDATGWDFVPQRPLDAVPTARFAVGDREWEMSLPLNPAGDDPRLASCRVAVVMESSPVRLQMSFSPERRVATFLEGMRRSRDFGMADAMLPKATELLFWKYQDPPGAVLGGLTLYRLGTLVDRSHWVENLARHAAWIPDGQALLAAVLVLEQDPRRRRHGLDALLAATRHRPLYTDGLSLAMTLLRHWPGDDREEERAAAIERLADLAAYADWNAVNLTTDITPRSTP